MKKRIKLFDPKVDFKEEKAILKILRSHYWASGTGIGNVAKFEEKFRNFVNSRECVALNSGTAALHLALSLVDIRNKEVILPSLSFVSTAHAVKYNGGKPIFVDVEPETLCIDPNSVKKTINKSTTNKSTIKKSTTSTNNMGKIQCLLIANCKPQFVWRLE